MKKLLLYVLAMAGGAAIGIGVMLLVMTIFGKEAPDLGSSFLHAAWLLLMMVPAFFIHIILHEAGHLICGLMSGYRFVSFRVGSYTLIKQDERYRIKRFGIAGTGGQCLMSPPVGTELENIPTVLYNAGGVIVNILIATTALIVWLMCKEMPDVLDAFVFALMFIGYWAAIFNGIPFRMGGMPNDGYNILYLSRNKQSVRSFAIQLLVNEQSQRGTRVGDMPEEWFTAPAEWDFDDGLQVGNAMMILSRIMDQGEVHKALHMAIDMWGHHAQLPQIFTYELMGEMVYLLLVTGGTGLAREFMADDKFMQYVRTYAGVMSSKQRWLMAIELLEKGDHQAAKDILDQVVAHRREYLMQGEVASDISMMESLLQR